MNKKIDDIRRRLGNLTKTGQKTSLQHDGQPVPYSIGSDSSPKRTGVGIEIRARHSVSQPRDKTLITYPDEGPLSRMPHVDRLADTQDMLSTARPIFGEETNLQSGRTILRDLNSTEIGGSMLSPRIFPTITDPNPDFPSQIGESQQEDPPTRSKKSILSYQSKIAGSQLSASRSKPYLWKKVFSKTRPLSKLKSASARLFNLFRTLHLPNQSFSQPNKSNPLDVTT